MKPNVISGVENPPAPAAGNQPSQQTNSNQYPPADPNNSREYPHHVQSGFSGFRPHFDDMFDDDDFGPHLRARMMRNPFAGFGGRFHDPEWDTMRTRRRAPQTQSNTRGNIFDHIPAEFRNILPDNFGFHQPTSQEFSQSYPPQQHHESHPQSQQSPQENAQQQYQNYPEQQQKQAPRPKYCDASIQTESESDMEHPNAPTDQGQGLNQQNLRNSMDFGQKSQQEGANERRYHSSPSVNDPNYASASGYAGSNNSQGAQFASTGTDPKSPQNMPRQQPEFQRPHPNQPPPPPQRSFIPPQYQNAPKYQNTPQPEQYTHQQSPPRAQTNSQEDGGFIRHVPIFVEGRSEPVNSPTPQRSRKFQQQQQSPPQSQQRQAPPQPQQRQAPPQPQQQQPARPTPLNTQQAQANAGVSFADAGEGQVPQTPQTAQSISKIQDIQRDVLNLMGQVEQFTGTKRDKEYIYLDEMLTRNLLKLDTIDTDGKDRIRLARREAIKCIQASINVLEAKAEENTKAAQTAPGEQNLEEVAERPDVIPLPNIEQKSNDVGEDNITNTKDPVDTTPATVPSETVLAAEPTEAPKVETENPPPVPESTEGPPQQQDPSQESVEIKVPIENPDIAAEQTVVNAEENATLELPKEQIEKSSSEKENKPPGSPKKKIVRKVKKVPDTKSASPGSGTTTDETVTPPNNEPDTASASAETAE